MISDLMDHVRIVVMINLPVGILANAPALVLGVWPVTTLVIHYSARERAKTHN